MTPRLAFVPLFSFALLGASLQPHQTTGGALFGRAAVRSDIACPAARPLPLAAGAVDWEQEGFEDGLPVSAHPRLVHAGGALVRCIGRDGAPCASIATPDTSGRTFDRVGACGHSPVTVSIVRHCAARAGAASGGTEDIACNSKLPAPTISRPSRHS